MLVFAVLHEKPQGLTFLGLGIPLYRFGKCDSGVTTELNILNVLIFTEGGQRLFKHDYDESIYQQFTVDNVLGFIDVFLSLYNGYIIKEPCHFILFSEKVMVIHYFQARKKGFTDVKYRILLVGQIDRTIPFDCQEIIMRNLAEYIAETFFDEYQDLFRGFLDSWDGVVNKFEAFHEQCDEIIQEKCEISKEQIQTLLKQKINDMASHILNPD
jgi:hypothetical protein